MTPTPSFLNKRRMIKKRAGVSPVIATTIILAITVTLGLALYSFTLSQTNTSTATFAQQATDYVNFRNDRFVVTSLNFNPASDTITAYVFNSGNVPVNITKAEVGMDDVKYCQATIASPGSVVVSSKNITSVIISKLPELDASGKPVLDADGNLQCNSVLPPGPAIYHVRLTSDASSYQTYFQKYMGE